MAKGTPNIRLFFNSRRDSLPNGNEPTSDGTMGARPPLSSLSASSRNNLGAAARPVHSTAKAQSRIDKRSPQEKRGQSAYPHLENVATPTPSAGNTPEKFVTPFATPVATPKSRAKRASGSTPQSLSSNDMGSFHSVSSTGTYGGGLSRTPSNVSQATTCDEDSAPSSNSGSDAENVQLTPQKGRRISLGPKIEAAVKKLQKTPSRNSSQGRSAASSVSPGGSLRSMSGVQRALELQQQNAIDIAEVQPHFDLEENLSFWTDHNVQVLIRTRPISRSESRKPDITRCLKQESAHAITWLGQPESRFTFDHVAGENISQRELFRVIGLPMVENCMAGYNSCMFAYGQTGSGKTHTMLGDIDNLADQSNDNRGMTPRIFEYLFARIKKEEQDRQLEQLRYVCKCSFLEIYNEQITDLLEPSSTNLQVREDSKKGVYVENLSEVVVNGVQDVVHLLLKGAANRRVASTNMNRESSRSHSLFACSVESKWETNSLINIRFGRLNLVDLAGSERQKSSGAEGERLKEAANINKSLSTLGLVIMILVDIANGKQRHVPYRDSKLTFLLQDSLGGNSKTAIIATVSPSSCCAMETLGTLKFAQRAKFIQNNAVINEDASGEVMALRREIQQLKDEVSRLRCQTISSMRRDCRRDSNEFFRMSLTGKDLFDSAEGKRSAEGEALKSAELLEKIKALEAVLAGALRREQAAVAATNKLSAENEQLNTLVQEREKDTQGYKNLLSLQGEKIFRLESLAKAEMPVETFLAEENRMLLEKLHIAEERMDRNPELTRMSLDNIRLSEQVGGYKDFYDTGERDRMLEEIKGLRGQVLELLDAKIEVERGSTALTVAQGDSYRKELEICRNDLTNCLEASSQLQRQVDDLQTLVDQLSEQCTEKDKELGLLKGGARDASRFTEMEIERALHQEELTDLTMQLQEREEVAEQKRAQLDQQLKDALQEIQKLQSQLQEGTETWSKKYEKMASRKEQEIQSLQFEWETSAAKLLNDLAEGDRALIEAEQEMELIIGEDWILKTLQNKTPRWSGESEKSPKEVDKEHDYFKSRNSCNPEDIFPKRKSSSGSAQKLSVSTEEKLRLQNDAIRLEVELQECKQRLQKVEEQQDELATLNTQNLDLRKENDCLVRGAQDAVAISEEKVNLERQIERLEHELREKTEAAGTTLSELEGLHNELVALQNEKAELREEAEHLAIQAQQAATLLQEKVKLEEEISRLESELRAYKEKAEEAQAAVVDLELREETEVLKSHAQESIILGLKKEIIQLSSSLEETQDQNQKLASSIEEKALTFMKESSQAKKVIELLEKQKMKLENELSIYQKNKESTELVREELRMTVSSLHAELAIKDELMKGLEFDTKAEKQAQREKLDAQQAEISLLEIQIRELEIILSEKLHALCEITKELDGLKATSDFVLKERDALKAQVEDLRAVGVSASKQVHDLQEELDTKSNELSVIVDQLQTVTEEMKKQTALFQTRSNNFADQLKQERVKIDELLSANGDLAVSLEKNENELCVAGENGEKLQAQLLSVKEDFVTTENDLSAAHEIDRNLQAEILSLKRDLTNAVEKTVSLDQKLNELSAARQNEEILQVECLKLKEELAIAQTLAQDHQNTIASSQQEIEASTSTIALLKETVEQLESDINRKEELLQGLEFDISLLQEHTAEDTDFKQELLSAKSRIPELQGEIDKKVEELRTLACSKDYVQEELMQKIASMRLVVEELNASRECAALVTEEKSSLNAQISSLQASVRNLDAELAEKCETVSSLEKELMVTRVTLTRMTLECSHKTEALTVLEGELCTTREASSCVSLDSENLRKQIAQLQNNVTCLEEVVELKVEEMDILKGESLVAMMTENCMREMSSELETQIVDLQARTSALEADLCQRSDLISSLEIELLVTRKSAETKTDRCANLEAQVVELQVKRSALELELMQQGEALILLEKEGGATLAMVTKERGELRAQVLVLQDSTSSMKVELEQKTESLRSLENKLVIANERLAYLAKESEDLKAMILDLQKEKEAFEKNLEQTREAATVMEFELATARDSAISVTCDRDELKEEIAHFQAEKDVLERELAQQNVKISAMQGELTAAKVSSAATFAEELAELIAKSANLQAEVDSLQGEVAQKREEISSMEGESSSQRVSAADLRKECDVLEKQNASLQAKLDVLERDTAQTTAHLQTLEVDPAAHHEEEASGEEFTDKSATIISLEAELTAVRGCVACITEERDHLRGELDKVLADRDAVEREVALKSAVVSLLQGEVRVFESSAGAMIEQITGLEAKVAGLQDEKDILHRDDAQYSGLISSCDNTDRRSQDLEASTTKTSYDLHPRIYNLQADANVPEGELVTDSAALNSIGCERERSVASCEEFDALEAQLKELEAEKRNLEGELAQRSAEIKSLNLELTAAGASAISMKNEVQCLKGQIEHFQLLKVDLVREHAEKAKSISLQEGEVLEEDTTSCVIQESIELRTQIEGWQKTVCSMTEEIAQKNELLRKVEDELMASSSAAFRVSQHMNELRHQAACQEEKLLLLEIGLEKKTEALNSMEVSLSHATQEVTDLKKNISVLETQLEEKQIALRGLENHYLLSGLQEETSQELTALRTERDMAFEEVQIVQGELRRVQSDLANSKSAAIEAQKFAEINILRASEKEDEARKLKASMATLRSEHQALASQLEDAKHEAERQRHRREELEMDLEGVTSRMSMLQAVHSTGSRNAKGFQAAQAASLDLQRQLEEKEMELVQVEKKLTTLQTERDAHASRVEEMETELASVNQELNELQIQCENKDEQIETLNNELGEAERLTQGVMRDLHSVKLDISNYASLVSQQQLELISERSRYSDEVQEKDEEVSNLQTQLNQERQKWMLEMNHKQAEIVVARVLSDKMRVKNKSLAAEYKKLKIDHGAKKRRLRLLEDQLRKLTEYRRSSVTGTESEDFDEVFQFQALLAQAQACDELLRKN